MNETEFYLLDLESRFMKINPKEYYLSYSGGKDSHFLYWFIKEWLHDTEIEIVSANTYMEHPEMVHRMLENADTILIPKMKPFEIKEQYGIPCFSKVQDDWIYRWQHGSRAEYLQKRIMRNGEDANWAKFSLSNKAKELLLANKLHPISPYCCKYLKKKPFKDFEKQTGKKAILGVRGGESVLRKTQYQSCFTKDKKFTPLHDLSDQLLDSIYKEYNIPIPNIYIYIYIVLDVWDALMGHGNMKLKLN